MTFLRTLMAVGILIAAILPTTFTRLAEASDFVGLRSIDLPVPARGAKISVTIWYPALPGGNLVRIGDSKVFLGVPARRDAPLAAGTFPIVLMLQGGLRSAPNLGGWIAASLAAQGFIVVTTHPTPLTMDKLQAIPAEIWLRPADLSASLDAILRDPLLAGHVAADRVAVLGMQLGGTAALALAGARLDPDRYSRSCDAGGVGLDCVWFAKNGIDLHKVDVGALGRSHLDRRIEAIVAVDPELTSDFTPASLAEIKVPVAIINLGAANQIAPALDASQLQQQIAGASYATLAGATPFSGFSSCTARGAEILRAEGDDERICQDGGTHSRDEIHRQLAARIEAFLGQNLRPVSAPPTP